MKINLKWGMNVYFHVARMIKSCMERILKSTLNIALTSTIIGSEQVIILLCVLIVMFTKMFRRISRRLHNHNSVRSKNQ